jgi:NodT family efflux transporter outer membrane factor (OMF) lipoprotein
MRNLRLIFVAGVLFSTGCMVGPKYQKPTAPAPPAFKEAPPAGWKEAQPNDSVLRGKWWEIYNDPQLNALEEQVTISNQNVMAAEARYRAARETVRVARTALYPTVTAGAAVTNTRSSSAGNQVGSPTRNAFQFPVVDFSYQADVFGAIRRSILASAENAQVTAAELEVVRLSLQAELALDYFQLHGTDSTIQLLEATVKSYEENLTLTKNRFVGGVASGADVAQAETQLNTAKAQRTDLDVARTQFEHAIAVLVGKAPSEVTIETTALRGPPPVVPLSMPSALLERRPDIASAERQMASQNEQIGIAKAAFYPSIGISASAGFQGSNLVNIFSWPARFWSLGPNISQVIYDAGRRKALLQQQVDLYDATVASYRQTVLTAFQQVEDALSALRVLENESAQTQQAVDAAQRSLDISMAQYKAGVATYLQVITAQAAMLQNQRSAVDVMTRRMTSSVLLVEALGGGWEASQLPTVDSLKQK